jgi:prepilin-type N-terminal cleavage/methylation domain-containing protein
MDTSVRGFSLVELLVVVTILSIGILGIASLFSGSSLQTGKSYALLQGNILLEQIIENSTQVQSNEASFKNITSFSRNTTLDGVTYSIQCNVTEDIPFPRCKEMNCSISWQNLGMTPTIRTTYVFSQKY